MLGNEIKKNLYFKYGVSLLVALVISLFFSHTIFNDIFASPAKEARLVITATAERNIKSGGSDIRIVRILLDGEDVPFDSIEKQGDWNHADGVWMVVNPDSPATLSYTAENVKELQVDFQMHDGSGVAEIWSNDKRISRTDLYSSGWESYYLRKTIGSVSIFNNLVMFAGVFLITLFCLAGMEQLIVNLRKSIGIKKGVAFFIGFYVVLYVISCYFNILDLGIRCGLILLVISALGANVHEWHEKRDSDKKIYRIVTDGVWLILSSVILLYMVELVEQNLANIGAEYIFGNIVIYLLFLMMVYMLVRSIFYSVSAVMLVMYIFSVANSFVRLFRGSPIVPGDFLAMGTAKNVFMNYHYSVTGPMLLALWLLIAFLVLTFYFYGREKRVFSCVLVWSLPSVCLLSFMMGGTLFAPDMDFWNQNINIQRYGIALSFISDIRHMKLEEPAGYSSKDSEEMISKFVETEDEKEQNCPNVIAIMNESFSDLSVIFPELDNEVYMSNFNSLSGNVVKGYMQVYPIGGGTANTEYEFLTGNSMAFLQGSIPYQQYITRNGTYSIAQILKTRGYHTTAIHPYDKRGYNRAQVYPKIGFETFLDVSDFENVELIRDRYISDRDSYKKVIEEFEKIRQSGQPAFIFNVTMQNHSGYDAGCFTENAVRIPGHEGEFPNAEEYLTLIRESDVAIPMLIDYFSKIEDPTVIVFFGDHQPMVEESFYETLAGKPLTEWTLAEAQSRYIVPFFIWANYEIDAEENVFTSANFLSELMFEKAGIKLLPYQEFLKEVREEIPAMDGGAWRDKDGTWEVLDTSQPILEEYWRLQYRNMFDKKVHY
ncbi:LTA synthase family protein [Clostridium sp.]|jgi:phosphoglycerol transferase MdoB-like AlkP superfamily enzyme|uniref:LTA synthase family protein n=1 Tax=Clostridium sp. TaxID=1506 RepID=UPI003521EF97